MIGKDLKDIGVNFNEIIKKLTIDVYKELTGMDINDFMKVVIEDVKKKEADAKKAKKTMDPYYKTRDYLNEKTEESYNLAIGAFLKEKNMDVAYEETYDEAGQAIVVFNLSQVIQRYVVPVDFTHEMKIGEMKKEVIS